MIKHLLCYAILLLVLSKYDCSGSIQRNRRPVLFGKCVDKTK